MSQSLYMVIGLGKTGLSIARYLKRRNLDFVIFDTREKPSNLEAFKQEFPDVACYLQQVPPACLDSISEVIASPGVALDNAFLQELFSRGISILGDVECLAKEVNAPIIAITGTNGKTTVTSLVGEMAAKAGFKVAVGGNIGTPVLELLDDKNTYDLWVLELSSFQLELTHSLAPKVGAILNLSPDHIDRHHNFDSYKAAKQRIYHQAEYLLFNREDMNTRPVFASRMSDDSKWITFGLDAPIEGDWGLKTNSNTPVISCGDDPLISVDQLTLKGTHNWMNCMAACALAHCIGIGKEPMINVLTTFKGLPHRCQWIRTLKGVEWINDSKGTNVGATLSAITGLGDSHNGKIVWIAGGKSKSADFSELKETIIPFVRSIVLIGEDAEKIAAALGKAIPIVLAGSMKEAVHHARLEAKNGDIVLLSPACASFDMFRDFNHRGEVFSQLVRELQ